MMKCDIIRDIMPLCVDDSASDDSKKMVFEHLAECKACEQYYNDLLHGFDLEAGQADAMTSEYKKIAGKIRSHHKKRRITAASVVIIVFALLLNYALGYRFLAETAAAESGKLNATSELLGVYEWGDVQFFFYDSTANYDTIAAERHWNGWKSDDNYLVWPKYPSDKDGLVVTSGLNYWKNDQGILLFPILSHDEEITKVEITAFEQTKTSDISTGLLTVLAFDNDDLSFEDNTVGFAYDINGNVKYKLNYDQSMVRWVWENVGA